MKMCQTGTKTWCIRITLLMLLIIFFYCFSYYLQRKTGSIKPPPPSRPMCDKWRMQNRWESLKFNITRKRKLFFGMEDFFWRQHNSAFGLPYGIKGMEPLLLKILAGTNSFKMPESIENLECRTCVVIGNGFGIRNHSLGAIIDEHHVIIRLNDAPVRGYEQDVGSKTTMRLFYPESAFYNPNLHNDPDTLQVLVPFKQQDLRWLKEILYNEKRMRKGFWKPPPQIWTATSSQIRVLDPYFLQHTASKLLKIQLTSRGKQKPIHPTTGILAVFMALNYCDEVHVAGFGYPGDQNVKQPIHYYGSTTMKSMKVLILQHENYGFTFI
ncbi:CMP-N-acetylneuraminate-beta-galactosamide-alpha-2,3-sialyltransferase 4 isoform X2 [Denticeps clupeoides]|uniref:CMP-N-acetylneuraminate-beta-galactosamide- alpha-2,3-sialyltransferase 4 isoform X2 n=1 Tax=Denticeps clupeoides TaxID=299321 RepID=UPI0010A31A91|nr:CMP-N-acetylneuraminate-beta-galactosamide-alpha-2,3-sialyltransferase 4 isoform X2 [Denticeps clupeoides]